MVPVRYEARTESTAVASPKAASKGEECNGERTSRSSELADGGRISAHVGADVTGSPVRARV